jgi:septum formation protein
MTPIVLCSTAAHRAALLRRLGLPFETARPDFDEHGLEHLPAADLAAAYALGKARSLVERYAEAGALLIGADQVPEIDGETLRKAETPEECAAQLAQLSGREHTLHTAVAVVDSVTGRAEVARTAVRLTMRLLSPAQIRRYVEADRPLGSAGGYTYEGLGVSLFADVRGQDDSAIVGLPLVAVVELLGRFGVDPLGAP